jgi:hypothetical protein
MHAYAIDTNERYSAPIALVAAAVAVSWLLSALAARVRWDYPWWLDAPTPLFVYGICYAAYDHWLWRLPFLSRLPNLAGTWLGVVSSSHDPSVRNDATLRIRQTWSVLAVELETGTSRSISNMASLAIAASSEPTLSYEYANEPKALSTDTMQAHRGTARLALKSTDRAEKLLEGEYYTGRGRATVGEMHFRFQSRDKAATRG